MPPLPLPAYCLLRADCQRGIALRCAACRRGLRWRTGWARSTAPTSCAASVCRSGRRWCAPPTSPPCPRRCRRRTRWHRSPTWWVLRVRHHPPPLPVAAALGCVFYAWQGGLAKQPPLMSVTLLPLPWAQLPGTPALLAPLSCLLPGTLPKRPLLHVFAPAACAASGWPKCRLRDHTNIHVIGKTSCFC